jgi:ADP-ribose pyrophosphatase YjhB (NUDIX family)
VAVTADEPRTRLAAYALCVDDARRILLCRIAPGYPAAGEWTLPGGGVAFGEDPADACLRELGEETGLSGTIRGLAFVHSVSGVSSTEHGARAWHGVRIVYHVDITGGELTHEQEESTDRAEWIPLAELDALPIVDLVAAARAALEEAP